MKHSSKKLWFKAKEYGWGWQPSSWEGWFVLAGYCALSIENFFRIDATSHSISDTVITFVPQTIFLTAFLILICYWKGEKPRWRWGHIEEQVLVLDESGNQTSTVVSKSVAHAKALWHQTAHVWILNTKGEVLLQKRALNKPQYPGVWGSTGGHVSYGETAAQAIVREVSEELGITVSESELTSLGRISTSTSFQNGAFTENEYIDMFLITLPDSEISFEFKDNEVSAVHWYTISDLLGRRSFDDAPIIFKDIEIATLTNYLSLQNHGTN